VNLGRETILESDLLNADAQLLKLQNAISDASDRVASASEGLNDLMARDVHTQFRVAAIDDADTDLAIERYCLGKLLSPERRRSAVGHACEHGMSERRACLLMGQPEARSATGRHSVKTKIV
jgi:hypothetical protein